MKKNILIVGAGFAGSVIARELASAGYKILIIEKRDHIAGNCYTKIDSQTNIMEHVYGPHIFNTDNENIWKYINKFGKIINFVNRVKCEIPKGIFSFPINLLTINQFYNKKFSPYEAINFINKIKSKIKNPKNFEEVALNNVGKDLYENFYHGYTKKQWGTDPLNLPSSVFSRIPIRFNYNDNYYNKKYQGIPENGYTEIIANIIKHKNISIKLNMSFTNEMANEFRHTFYSGEIDKFFEFKYGKLSYRTVYWKKIFYNGDFQGNAGINFPSLKDKHTRVYEHKHLTPWKTFKKSIVFYEYSKETDNNDIPYYPKNLKEDKIILKKYNKLSKKFKNLTFIGRLGLYRYINMDETIDLSLKIAKKFLLNKINEKK